MTTKQPKTDWRVVSIGIICLTAAELFALSEGMNGILFSTFIGIIALAIGISVKNPFVKN